MLEKVSTMVAYRIIPMYVHVVRQSFASSVQLLNINLWLPHAAIKPPSLASTWRPLNKFFDQIIKFHIEVQWTLGSAATTVHWQ